MAVAEGQHHSSAADSNQEIRWLELVAVDLGSQWAAARKETDCSADID